MGEYILLHMKPSTGSICELQKDLENNGFAFVEENFCLECPPAEFTRSFVLILKETDFKHFNDSILRRYPTICYKNVKRIAELLPPKKDVGIQRPISTILTLPGNSVFDLSLEESTEKSREDNSVDTSSSSPAIEVICDILDLNTSLKLPYIDEKRKHMRFCLLCDKYVNRRLLCCFTKHNSFLRNSQNWKEFNALFKRIHAAFRIRRDNLPVTVQELLGNIIPQKRAKIIFPLLEERHGKMLFCREATLETYKEKLVILNGEDFWRAGRRSSENIPQPLQFIATYDAVCLALRKIPWKGGFDYEEFCDAIIDARNDMDENKARDNLLEEMTKFSRGVWRTLSSLLLVASVDGGQPARTFALDPNFTTIFLDATKRFILSLRFVYWSNRIEKHTAIGYLKQVSALLNGLREAEETLKSCRLLSSLIRREKIQRDKESINLNKRSWQNEGDSESESEFEVEDEEEEVHSETFTVASDSRSSCESNFEIEKIPSKKLKVEPEDEGDEKNLPSFDTRSSCKTNPKERNFFYSDGDTPQRPPKKPKLEPEEEEEESQDNLSVVDWSRRSSALNLKKKRKEILKK
ncbi:unnamed protein product [Caenorhabditis auriculariae]|uniref:Uncharacterized protein n=1 Tax=Caenorhabditis auriculariae TaxID=2777116 RepID=A0A8S1GRN5_9PELO|nr:unnamed protein product [Caenorhabditis auriculariae]